MLRDAIAADGQATLTLDLAPGRSFERLRDALSQPRGGRSLSEHLRRQAGIEGVKAGLVYEVLGKAAGDDPATLAGAIKRLPIRLKRPRPLAEAISTAGGVRIDALDDALMLHAQDGLPPGVFCAGEMLDWEAPTGGYLLTACFASGLRAGRGAAKWLAGHPATD
jgi:predicted flavoprotein YhiN